jgi:hypothetical protein
LTIADFQTKTLADDITLTDRDVNGCCAAGSVPGVFAYSQYQSAQIVCGRATGDQSYAKDGNNKCNYGTCYVYHQNLPCADGTKQRLNGCCATHATGTFANFPDTCLGYEDTFTNTESESVEYCRTYHKDYSKIGNMGTTDTHDDVANALTWLGGTPPGTLKACQGDCDADGDCPSGSTCIDRTGHVPAAIDGCAVGDSMDTSRADTDYCSNPGSSAAASLHISCLNEYAACCGHAARNGACASGDYMAATNSALSANACVGGVTGGNVGNGGNNNGATTKAALGNSSDGTIGRTLGGGVALLAAGACLP